MDTKVVLPSGKASGPAVAVAWKVPASSTSPPGASATLGSRLLLAVEP